ncbi:ATP-binding protein [Undibacterium sp.]|uniref:ATP-binding protein n=1 Tax=Undibacterium sp. TaxID=1914977 RepID=UPI00374FEF3D
MPTKNKSFSLPTIGTLLALFVSLIITGIVAQSWWAIEQDRKLTIDSEYQHGLVAVRLLEEHASQTLRDAERNLDTVVNAILIEGKQKPITDDLIRQVLTKAQPFNRVLKALQFVNPAGQAWVSSIDYPAYQTDADDRVYIPYLLQHKDEKKVILGRPFQRFYDGELVVPVARNVHLEDGSYLGIISTDISVAYFSNVYQRVAQDSKAMVSLFTDTGVIIVRFPFNPDQVGKDLSNSSIIQTLKHSATEGMFEERQFLSDQETKPSLYTFRKFKDYPVISIFARETETILSPWRERSESRILFSSLIILLVILLSLFLWRQFRRLHQSEQSLIASEAHLKSSESKFTHLFENSPMPLALLSFHDQKILAINNYLLQQWGYTLEQTLHKSLDELQIWVNRDDAAIHKQLLRESGVVKQLEVRLNDSHARQSICQISSKYFVSNTEQLLIFSPLDISRLREVESEIRNLNTQLEEKVIARTHSLAEANRELEQALSAMKVMQDEMFRSEKMAALGYLVAGISHELNTPIGNSLMVASTIHDHAQTLAEEINNGQLRKTRLLQLIEDTKKGADILLRNLQRAAQLIFSFKQVAVDQSSDQCRVFDLKNTLEEILLTVEPVYKRTAYQLHADLEPGISMESYPGALAQILNNAINNTLSHGFDGRKSGQMQLTTRSLNETQIELLFSDDGIGIPSQHINQVFDPFFTTKLGQGGSGLGLHIVYNLVTEVLGGSVTLNSKAGGGTHLRFILPKKAPAPHRNMP